MTGNFIDVVAISGETLLLYRTSILLVYVLPIQHRFFVPNSNFYTLDFVFDAPNCKAFIAGSEIDTGAQILLDADPVDFSWRVRIFDGFAPLHTLSVDLTPLPHYWRPP